MEKEKEKKRPLAERLGHLKKVLNKNLVLKTTKNCSFKDEDILIDAKIVDYFVKDDEIYLKIKPILREGDWMTETLFCQEYYIFHVKDDNPVKEEPKKETTYDRLDDWKKMLDEILEKQKTKPLPVAPPYKPPYYPPYTPPVNPWKPRPWDTPYKLPPVTCGACGIDLDKCNLYCCSRYDCPHTTKVWCNTITTSPQTTTLSPGSNTCCATMGGCK